jgi:hypothetical protein
LVERDVAAVELSWVEALVDLLPERSVALAVEEVAVLGAEEWRAFRAEAARAAGAENSEAKARRAVMGALKRILEISEARNARALSTLSMVGRRWK